MLLLFIPKILDTCGTLLIAYAALRVHHRVLNEKKIDNRALKEMKWEQMAGVVGVCCILMSLLIEFFILT